MNSRVPLNPKCFGLPVAYEYERAKSFVRQFAVRIGVDVSASATDTVDLFRFIFKLNLATFWLLQTISGPKMQLNITPWLQGKAEGSDLATQLNLRAGFPLNTHFT